METRKAILLIPLFLGIAAISATGCELIASVDRSEIGTKTSSSSAGGGGMGGAGSTSGSMSGSGGSGGCASAVDCPDPMNECVTATCTASVCGTENVAVDTPTTTQTMGDCKQTVCDGMGAAMDVDDTSDAEDDSNSCTDDTCNAGVTDHTPIMAGTACTDGGGKVCSAAGTCVECNIGNDCTGKLCSNNACIQINECDYSNAVDMTGMASVSVAFGGMTLGMTYDPKCLQVSVGTTVTFNGSFMSHPLMGGEVVSTMPMPATSGPFVPMTSTGMSKAFTMSTLGTFPYYCDVHAGMGMFGTIFVVP